MIKLVLLAVFAGAARTVVLASVAAQDARLLNTLSVGDCLTNSLDSSVFCRGSRAINNVLNNLNKNDKPIVLLRGLEIVPAKELNISNNNNTDRINELTDHTFLGRFAQYLRTHELNLKFADLLADESERHVARDWERSSDSLHATVGEARSKKDKGQGMVLVVVAMFAKMMAAMGLGGVGLLAMKALGVAAAALALAAIVGLKSLGQNEHESKHSVQYIPAEGHHHSRRRRSLDKLLTAMPYAYRGWHTELQQ